MTATPDEQGRGGGNDQEVKGARGGGERQEVARAADCTDQGVVRHDTAPYTPQQNSVVERRNQIVVGMPRSMMKAKKIPTEF